MDNRDIDIQLPDQAGLEASPLLADIVKMAKIGGWKLHVASGKTEWTSEIYRIYGLSDDHSHDVQDALSFYDMPGRETLIEAIQECIDTGKPYSLELPFTNAQGKRLWVHTLGQAIRKDGKTTELIGTFQDITERKRVEQSLRSSKERLRLLSQQVPGLVYEFQMFPDGRYCFPYVSGHARHVFGMDATTVMKDASGVFDCIHTDDRERAHESIQESFRTLNIWEQELRYLHPRRGLIWIWGISKPKAQPDGSVLWRGYLADITARKANEQERQKLQAQLSQAQKMESVGRLAGGVAHDFNNMLGVILGNVQLVREEIGAEHPLQDELADIEKAAKSSVDLTRQLLAFARKQTVAPQSLDLNETVAGMLKMLRRVIGEEITLDWRPGEDVGRVLIDPSQMDQIMANLCVNARDAITGAGTITIETASVSFDSPTQRTQPESRSGDFVMLSVSDDGCGIDAEIINHLFEPFFTTKDVGKGSGLGLATVYGAVKQNKGFIEVYGDPGRGTTFKIYFPRHVEPASSAPQISSTSNPNSGNETVLLVEDESSLLKMTKTILERLGYAVLSAATPKEAINLAKQYSDPIAILLTDVVLPDMNGREVERMIRSIHPETKCLFMSGYTADVIAEHGVLDPEVQFIEKPFNKEQLATKIRRVLEGA